MALGCALTSMGVVTGIAPFAMQSAAALGSDLSFQPLSFQPEADLFSSSSNLSPGFSKRYESVAVIDGVIIDAVVTIVSQAGNVGSELSTFDQYDNTQHLSAHTEPSGTGEASGKIRVDFVADGTSNPVVLKNVRASIADIDEHEFGTFFGISRYRLAAGTFLTRSGSTMGTYRFHSSRTDTPNTDEERIIEVDYDATSSITTEFGCRQNASQTIGPGGKCGFTVVIGTPLRTLGVIETSTPRPTYTVTYFSNGGTAGIAPSQSSGTGEIVISANTGSLAKSQEVFLGWNTVANGTGVSYPPGYTFIPTEDTVLYAQYGSQPSPPIADNETSSGGPDANQTINVLVGDTAGTGAALNPSSVRLCAVGTANSSCTLTSMLVPDEGTYTVDPQTGVVTFDPLPGFVGAATSIKYVVSDSTGQVADATISPTVTDPSTPPSISPTPSPVVASVSEIGDPAPEAISDAEFTKDARALPSTGSNWAVSLGAIALLVFALGTMFMSQARRKTNA